MQVVRSYFPYKQTDGQPTILPAIITLRHIHNSPSYYLPKHAAFCSEHSSKVVQAARHQTAITLL